MGSCRCGCVPGSTAATGRGSARRRRSSIGWHRSSRQRGRPRGAGERPGKPARWNSPSDQRGGGWARGGFRAAWASAATPVGSCTGCDGGQADAANAMTLRIVTATRGNSPYWEEMVASIRAAAPGAGHVIVCPAAAVGDIRSRAPGARVVAETGTGLYAALNQGLREPPDAWDAFTWLNDDDRLVAPGFQELCGQMDRQRDVAVAYGRVELINRNGGRV